MPLPSPSSGSDYEEDARAAGMRCDQIAPKWRKPTIKEQDALNDEDFEQEVEQSLQMHAYLDSTSGPEDKEEEDEEEDEDEGTEEGETYKARPIPLEAKERAFECYKTFMQSIEEIAKKTEKPVSSILKLVGLGGVKLPRGTTKWSYFQAYYGVYGEEKNPEDVANWTKTVTIKYKETSEEQKQAIVAWHKSQYEASMAKSREDGSFSKIINKTQDSFMRLASPHFTAPEWYN
ncbi:hypothetical protein H0H92_006240 [Tricholoma furcatifolium]|nr:hypothetical protein H0H92_006240 [Tricholoma furcatifolium]